MKNIIIIIATILFSTAAFAQVNTQYHKVSGYTKSNGTYVQPYYRTNSNNTINDNYSTAPNVNPHTGRVGTIQSVTYSTPTYYNTNSQPAYKSNFNYSTPNSIFK